ncbi:MAG: hypothetical protein HWE30_00470 [Methylocystaceae bacterium]|nr:hypothetical protein [Methylocystaceae bacterium]
MKNFLAIAAVIILSACSYPHTNTTTVNDEPTLVFEGTSSTAEVYLNGLNVGLAANYNGEPNSLIVPRGTHQLEIRDNGTIILSEKIFVSDGSVKTISLTGSK